MANIANISAASAASAASAVNQPTAPVPPSPYISAAVADFLSYSTEIIHQCEYCRKETITPWTVQPGDGRRWEGYHKWVALKTPIQDLCKAAEQCPLFAWIWSPLERSGTHSEQLNRTTIFFVFESRQGNLEDVFRCKLVYDTKWYTWSPSTLSAVMEWGRNQTLQFTLTGCTDNNV